MSKLHELKTDPAVFDAVKRGDKTNEMRLDDRRFSVGDTLVLKETVHSGQKMRTYSLPVDYTGRTETRLVSHIQTGYGLKPGWCILSFAATPSLPVPAILTWEDRFTQAHPRSEPEYWADAMKVMYMAKEIADLRAALSVAAVPGKGQAVRHEMRMRAPNGNYGVWRSVDHDVFARFQANPDIGAGYTYETRALYTHPSPVPMPVAVDRNAIDLSLKWAVRELLSSLPERRDWFNPDAERELRDFVQQSADKPAEGM